jgi:hypothetical protein
MNDAAIILTNYRRPRNLPRQLLKVKQLANSFDVFVIDNSDRKNKMRNFVAIEDWYTYIENGLNLGAGYRFIFSCSLPHKRIIALDDDIFLEPEQIVALSDAIFREPQRVHGVWGQTIELDSERHRLKVETSEHKCSVDVISRVYAYAPKIAFLAVCLAERLGFSSWADIGPTDDILLSAASMARPIRHALGPWSVCETSDSVEIALWRSAGFFPARDRIIDQLLERGYLRWESNNRLQNTTVSGT